MRVIVYKLPNLLIPVIFLTICIFLGSGDTTQKSDTTLNLSSSESGGLSDTPILPDTERNLKQSPSLFARILSRVLKYIGLLLALFASICMSLVTLVVKFMEDYHPVSKVIWRLQGVLFPSLLFLLFVKFYQKRSLITWRNGGQDRSTYWRWQILILLVVQKKLMENLASNM